MTTTLEETLKAICAEHDLTYFGVVYHDSDARPFFSVTCQWDGFSQRNLACASANGPNIATAASDALLKMKQDRTPDVGEVPTLPAFEVAA